MEPLYKGYKDLVEFYNAYGWRRSSTEEERQASEELGRIHNHACWLNPTESYLSRRT